MINLLTRAWKFRLLVLLAAFVAPVALTGCNAVDGFGEDLQESSENVSDAVEE